MVKKPKSSKAKDAESADESGAAAAPAAPSGAPAAQSAAAGQVPPPNAPGNQPLAVNAQYTKDLSFEAPAAPGVFMQMQKEAPDINVNIDVRAQPFQQKNVYEVTLHIRAECKVGGTTGFMLELQYAGLFTLNIPENQVQPMVMIECPRFLFPFARNIIADATRDGGFPPLMLGPVDFAAMFRTQAEKQKAAADTAAPGANAGADAGTAPAAAPDSD